jgi:adenosine kinase
VVEVGAIPGVTAVDPTGVGDSFRAGFLAGLAAGLNYERSAQIGCTIASLVVETTGTQEYTVVRESFLARLGGAYGADAANEVGAALQFSR